MDLFERQVRNRLSPGRATTGLFTPFLLTHGHVGMGFVGNWQICSVSPAPQEEPNSNLSLFELVGFFLLILFLLAPVLRKIFGRKKKKPPAKPPSIQREVRPPLERSPLERSPLERSPIAPEVVRYRPPPQPLPPPPVIGEKPEPHHLSTVQGRELHSSLEDYEGMTATGEASFVPTIGEGEPLSGVALRYAEDTAYRHHREGASTIARLLRTPGVGREMVLLNEVLAPPKALR